MRELDDFTRGYLEAMFWTDAGPDSEDLADAGMCDLAPEALKAIKADCAAWQAQNFGRLKLACASDGDYTMARAGHDYWLTRNGHGTGFWDRPELQAIVIGKNNDRKLSDILTENCQDRPVCLYRGDDGKVYVS